MCIDVDTKVLKCRRGYLSIRLQSARTPLTQPKPNKNSAKVFLGGCPPVPARCIKLRVCSGQHFRGWECTHKRNKMVTTRSAAREQDSPLPGKQTHAESPGSAALNGKAEGPIQQVISWAETHGAGDHSGAWGIEGAAGKALAYAGTMALMLCCPAFAIYV